MGPQCLRILLVALEDQLFHPRRQTPLRYVLPFLYLHGVLQFAFLFNKCYLFHYKDIHYTKENQCPE
jgi:hypothetical protein